jgi:hypothetical protein
MGVAYWIWIAWMGCPPLLLLIDGRKHKGKQIAQTVLLVSCGILIASVWHDARWVLLGPDYSRRLYSEIAVNLLLSLLCGLYLGIKKRFIGGVAGVMLSGAWLYLGAVNSVV